MRAKTAQTLENEVNESSIRQTTRNEARTKQATRSKLSEYVVIDIEDVDPVECCLLMIIRQNRADV